MFQATQTAHSHRNDQGCTTGCINTTTIPTGAPSGVTCRLNQTNARCHWIPVDQLELSIFWPSRVSFNQFGCLQTFAVSLIFLEAHFAQSQNVLPGQATLRRGFLGTEYWLMSNRFHVWNLRLLILVPSIILPDSPVLVHSPEAARVLPHNSSSLLLSGLVYWMSMSILMIGSICSTSSQLS